MAIRSTDLDRVVERVAQAQTWANMGRSDLAWDELTADDEVHSWAERQAADQYEEHLRARVSGDPDAVREAMDKLLEVLAQAASERRLTRGSVPSEIDPASWRTIAKFTRAETVAMLGGRFSFRARSVHQDPAGRGAAQGRTAPRPRARRERHVARKTASADSGDSSSEPPLDPLARLRRALPRVKFERASNGTLGVRFVFRPPERP